MVEIQALLTELCSQVRVLPLRYHVRSSCAELTVPLLRSVLGKALWTGYQETYRSVFRRDQQVGSGAQAYVLSGSADADPDAFVVTLTLVGNATGAAEAIDASFREAAAVGVGRHRAPLVVEACRGVRPDESPTTEPIEWPLSMAEWCGGGDPASAACRLDFHAPLRLQAHRTTASAQWSESRPLIAAPSFSNLVAAGLNRLASYLAGESRQQLQAARAELLRAAELAPCSAWRGRKTDVERWSASQQCELQLRGVTGSIELPDGAGAFWPLMAAARWLHLGKNTTHGLGAFEVVAIARTISRSAPLG
jgi:hypothetical protein